MNASNPLSKEGLETLALRCESATGPDRDLDLRIAKAVGVIPGHYEFRPDIDGGKLVWGGICGMKVPAYTASLDAAMTLVPEGHQWAVMSCGELDVPRGCVTNPPDGGCKDFMSDGWTAALALCAAALRAKFHLLKGNEHG